MAKGGKRPGAGRPKGSLNQKTLAVRKGVEDSGLSPIEFLTQLYRDETQDMALRKDAAAKVAPYLYPRLSSQEISADMTNRPAGEKSNEELIADLLTSGSDPELWALVGEYLEKKSN